MARSFLAGVFLVGMACVGFAKDPTHSRDTPIVIKHDPGQQVRVIRWQPLDERHVIRQENQLILAAPPGEYLIVGAGNRVLQILTIVETAPGPDPIPGPQPGPPGPQPDPQPGPNPNPQPNPEPAPEKLKIAWAIWVESIQDRSRFQNETATMVDQFVDKLLDETDIKKKTYDDDQPEAAVFLPLVKQFAKEGRRQPALILYESPERYLVFPAPKTYDELEKLIRRHAIR